MFSRCLIRFYLIAYFFICTVACQAGDVVDLFLNNTVFLSNKTLLERLYDQTSTQMYARQFERLFPRLYFKDQAENIKEVENRLIIRLLKLFDHIQKNAHGLSWCSCDQAPISLRIRLALEVFDHVLKKYTDTTQKIVYTSYASGKLLQDLIIIAGLIELGYCHLAINIIDIAYERQRQDLALLYAQVSFSQQVKAFLYDKQKNDSSYNPVFEIKAYHNVYDYIQDVQRGVAPKSNILVMVDPGSELLHKDFEYFGQKALASLIDFELENKITHIALYIPRNKNIRYFYAQALSVGDKEKLRKALSQVQHAKLKKNFSEYLVQAVLDQFCVSSVKYFQSPFRSFDDLKHDGAVDQVLIYQLCDGIITHDVRDGLPLKNYSKIWL